jgi:hypothetical protein
MNLKVTVFWDGRPYILADITDISQEYAVSVFRIEE